MAPATRYAVIILALIVLTIGLRIWAPQTAQFPENWNLGLRQPLNDFQSWVIGHRLTHPIFLYFFDPLSDFIDLLLRGVEGILMAIPWPVLITLAAALANRTGGRNVAIFSVMGILIMGLFGLWKESIQTLSLMSVSVLLSLLIGIPVGIFSARHPRFEALLRPILDAMQTLPAFVYLIPVLLFFGIARVPSVIATVIYALPPAIRLTSLGIRQVAPSVIEAANAFGSTEYQKLVKVQLPLALPAILVGVNQTIMMALGIVVIAAMIGSGGLGLTVLNALRSQKPGIALEGGLAIVLMAVIFDRISAGLSRNAAAGPKPAGQGRFAGVPAWLRNYIYWATTILIALILFTLFQSAPAEFPKYWRFTIHQPVDAAVKWMSKNLYEIPLGGLTLGTKPISDFTILHILNPLRDLFSLVLPWPVVVLGIVLLGYQAAGWRLALTTALCSLGLGLVGMWLHSMDTLSQVLVIMIATIAIGLPLGIGAVHSRAFNAILNPMLDLLQTIPPFVYLVPVIMLFNVGRVPGLIASVLYALPPMIRLTSLGIRQVPPNTVEAARSFGSTPGQMLVKVQLPLALPSIMMGVNQSIMMALSMVIIAGLVGGGALGLEAVNGLARSDLGRGIEAGIAIVLLAVILDRITQGWGKKR
jgi:glycine betaine/proline transport system permease protein